MRRWNCWGGCAEDAVIFGPPIPGVSYTERPAAYVVVMNSEGMVAVVNGKRGYFLPGGGSLPDEAPEETVLREVREELARGIRILGRLGEAIQYFSADAQHFKMHAVFFAGEFTDEPSGLGEHELFWLQMTEREEGFFHQSHVWAIRQAGQWPNPYATLPALRATSPGV